MKIPSYFAVLFAFILSVGCQSNRHSTSANASPPVYQPFYIVESIPALPRLTPTSREGDKGPIYSSNIIAVYVVQPGDTNAAEADPSEQKNK